MIGAAERAAAVAVGQRARRSALGGWLRATALAHPDRLAAAGLLLAALVYYFPLVFLGRSLADYDAFVYFYPQRAYLAHALLAGQLPLWDPDLFLGAPFLANPQTAVLYPPSWLFVLGPVDAIYTVQLVLHGALAACGTYLLVRRAFGVGPAAGLIGGLAYAFGGFAVAQVGHLNQISAAAWLPLVLLAFRGFVESWRLRWLALGGLALGLQLFAGHPQDTYMTLLALAVFGLVMVPWRSPRRLGLAVVGGLGMCLLGAAVAAAQLLPTLELAPLSIRGGGVDWSDAVAGSLPSYLAIRALLPPYWTDVPYTEYLGYVGVVPLTLGLLGILGGRRRAVAVGMLAALIGISLALGENSGVFGWAFATVPEFDTFRVPARWLLLWAFGAAVLAAAGADWIAQGARLWPRERGLWLRVTLVVGVLVVGLAWQRNQGEPFPQRRTPFAFGALAAATLAIGALPHLRQGGLSVGLLVVLVGGELWAAGDFSPARRAPPTAVGPGETTQWLLAHGVSDQQRLLSLARPEYVPASEDQVRAELGSRLPEDQLEALLVAQKWRDTLTPNLPLQFGLNTADGYDGGVLPLERWVQLSTLLVPSPRPDGVLLSRLEQVPSSRLLDLLGVQYVITGAQTPARPDVPLAQDFGDLHLLARPAPVPRSLVVFAASVADDQTALARMAQADFDPNQEVILAPGGAPSQTGGSTTALAIAPERVSSSFWEAHVSLPRAGYLLQREAWYPGWQARVDGEPVPVERADVLLRAVPVPAGQHDVQVFFQSSSFARGALISVVGLLVVILGLVGRRPILRTRGRT